MKKTILATISVALGVLALCYIVVAHSLTLVRVGLSVPNQLVAQRIITFVVFASLVALPFGVSYFTRRLPPSFGKSLLVRILVVGALVVVPIVLLLFSVKSPIWAFPSPSTWERPQFYYGWPLPTKRDGGVYLPLGLAFVNWIFWTLYLQWVLGSRRLKHYIITLSIALVLSCLGLWSCGRYAFSSVHRGRAPNAPNDEAPPLALSAVKRAHGAVGPSATRLCRASPGQRIRDAQPTRRSSRIQVLRPRRSLRGAGTAHRAAVRSASRT